MTHLATTAGPLAATAATSAAPAAVAHKITTSDAILAPLVVSFGAGVDSTAMVVGFWTYGVRPDLILFADTGDELEETYLHVWLFQAWLEAHGMPGITVVRRKPTKRAPYETIYENAWQNETLYDLAFGYHSCSAKWKVEPQDKYVDAYFRAHLDAGGTVTRCIGFDAGDRDSERACKSRGTFAAPKADPRWTYRYPLQEWGWDRAACIEVIRAAGAPVPIKSACGLCPARTKPEIVELRFTRPDVFARAVALEERARNGKHGLRSVKGLGRRFAWSECPSDPVAAAEWAKPKKRGGRRKKSTQLPLPLAA